MVYLMRRVGNNGEGQFDIILVYSSFSILIPKRKDKDMFYFSLNLIHIFPPLCALLTI